jgi:hypothetical protein
VDRRLFPHAFGTLFPHAFGLRTPSPLWTAAAFDRCLIRTSHCRLAQLLDRKRVSEDWRPIYWLQSIRANRLRFCSGVPISSRASTLLLHGYVLGACREEPSSFQWVEVLDSRKLCLMLALLYPVAIILVMWMVSGHVGPAEHALGLRPDIPSWRRAGALAGLALYSFGVSRFVRATEWVRADWIWLLAANAGLALFIYVGNIATPAWVAAVVANFAVGLVAVRFMVPFGVLGAVLALFAALWLSLSLAPLLPIL